MRKNIQTTASLFDSPKSVGVASNPFGSGRDMRNLGLIALDIATVTGFCTCTTSGVWNLTPKKDESKGMRLIRFKAKLKEVCELEKIQLLAFEMPAINGKFPNFVGMEMVGVMKLFCAEHNIEHKGYPPMVIKKFAGHGHFSKDKMIKSAMDKYGCVTNDDNEADAVHLYHLAIEDLHL